MRLITLTSKRACSTLMCMAVVLVWAAAAPRLAHAQGQTTGAIGGTVTDAQHAAIAGAKISVKNLATGAAAGAVSDGAGRFVVAELPPGAYRVDVDANGMSPFQIDQVVVNVGTVTNVNASVRPGTQSQTVEVTGAAPLVDTEQSQVATDVDEHQLDNLPINQRRWSYFGLTAANVVPDGTYGDISYDALPYMFDNNTVDGAANTQAFFAEEEGRTRMGYSTSLESIQEFQVSDSNYSAAYGHSTGGVVNAVTKSGTNTLHGDAYYYNRDNTIGGAYNPFSTGPVELAPGDYTTQEIKPLDLRQQMGGDVGGAIIKDKLFFYVNYDLFIHHFPTDAVPSTPNNFFQSITVAMPAACNSGTADATYSGSNVNRSLTTGQVLACRGFTQSQVNAAYGVIAGLSGTVPRTGDQDIVFPKIDWHPTAAQAFSVSYNRVRWASPYGVETGSVVARGIDSQGNDYVNDDRVDANWSWTLGSSVNDARVIWSRDFEFEDTTPSLPGEPVSSLGVMPGMDIDGCDYAGGGSATSATLLPCGFDIGAPYFTPRIAYPNEQRLEAMDSYSFTVGNHFLKVGADVARAGDDLNSYANGDQYGEYAYYDLQDALSDFITATNHLAPACQTVSAGTIYQVGCWEDYYQSFGPPTMNFATYDIAGYVQDDWHYSPRLTLNLGLRWDHEALPAPQLPNPLLPPSQTMPSDDRDFGPRIGFAWDVTGQGRFVVRGGYGVYYGLISNEQIYQAMAVDGAAGSQIYPSIYPTTGSSNDLGTPTPGTPQFPNIMTSYSAASGAPSVVYLPSDTRLPAAEQFNLTVENQISAHTALSLSYIGNVGRFLPTGIDTNLPPATILDYTVIGGPANGEIVPEPFFAGPRPNPNFQKIVKVCTCVISRYNAATIRVTHQLAHGLQFDANYTYSQADDDGIDDSPGISGNVPVNPANLAAEYGRSALNTPNRFVLDGVYQPRYFSTHGGTLVRDLFSDWSASVNDTAETGVAYSPAISGAPPSGLKVNGLSATVSGSSGGPTGGGTSSRAWFLPKDGYHMPNLYNTDARLGRSFTLTERSQLEFTVDAFNLFNHLNITSATTTAYATGGTATAPTLNYSSSFGAVTNGNNSVFYGPRQLQFGIKLSF